MENSEGLKSSANSTDDYYYDCDENCQTVIHLLGVYERFSRYHFGIRCFFCILGILTNLSFIYVMARVKFIRMNVNYYLLNLSVADFAYMFTALMILFFKNGVMPNSPNHFFESSACYLENVVLPIPMFISILTVFLISIERYLSICRFDLSRLQITRTRTILLVVATWFAAASYCSIFVLICEKPDTPIEAQVSVVFIPLVVLATVTIVLYTLVVRVIKRHVKMMSSMQGNDRILLERKQLIKMLVITTAVFFTCQFIYVIGRFANSIVHREMAQGGSLQVAIPLSIFCALTTWFQYLNSIVNPILYNVISRKHRLAYKKAFCCFINRPEEFHCVDSQRESTTKVTRAGRYELAVEEPHQNGEGMIKGYKEYSTTTIINKGL